MWRRVPCEQQLNMGQSVLRHGGKPLPKSLIICESVFDQCKGRRCMPKGNRVNIPEPSDGDRSFGIQCGNASELRDVGGSPGKSCLFFVKF
jgi:hypothetical protein